MNNGQKESQNCLEVEKKILKIWLPSNAAQIDSKDCFKLRLLRHKKIHIIILTSILTHAFISCCIN